LFVAFYFPSSIAGLRAIVTDIFNDTRPRRLYSIGTAGGGSLNHGVGDAVVTNSAQLLSGVAPNDSDPANGKTFTCSTWYPSTSLFAAAQKLMFQVCGSRRIKSPSSTMLEMCAFKVSQR